MNIQSLAKAMTAELVVELAEATFYDDEIVWLITLLANQSILIHNLKNPSDKR